MSKHAHLYNQRKWQSIRRWQLLKEPLCRFCKEQGRITPATVCDHVIPHRGNQELFVNGPFQSLCDSCHSNDKQRMETGGLRIIGIDGWPVIIHAEGV